MVSIVLPSYNHARYLRTCIQSVVDQTFSDWQLIFIDDGSQDDSVEVARSFSDPRIRVEVNEKNLGTYATQNKGIDLATGEWIAILNSDDYWAPTKLALQLEVLADHPECAFSYTRGVIVDDEDRASPQQLHHRDYPTEVTQDLRPYLVDVNQVLASSLVFRKGVVRFQPELRYCGDWVASWRLACHGKVAFVDAPLTYWRQHTSNSFKELEKTVLEEVRIRAQLLGVTAPSSGLWKQKRAAAALNLAAQWLLLGNNHDARRACSIALTEGTGGQRVTAAKRLLATVMPRSKALARVWPGVDGETFLRLGEGYEVKPFDPPLPFAT